MLASPGNTAELFSEVAYVYDGSLEGLLSAIFAAYERREHPTDVEPESRLQPRLDQRIAHIATNPEHVRRVHAGLVRACGEPAFEAVKRATLCSAPGSGTAAYRFVRYAMDIAPNRRRALSEIVHPDVEPLQRILKRISNESLHMMQFIRFEELEGGLWFARCNPKDSVVPLIMEHFASRFNTQPFIIYDENHHLAGVYEGREWYLVPVAADSPLRRPARESSPSEERATKAPASSLPHRVAREAEMQAAWKAFYRSVAIESRYNPELRRQFMPKRLWRNITEMQEDLPSLRVR